MAKTRGFEGKMGGLWGVYGRKLGFWWKIVGFLEK